MPFAATINDSGELILTMSAPCDGAGTPDGTEFTVLDGGIPAATDAVSFDTSSSLFIQMVTGPVTEDVTIAYTRDANDWRSNATGELVADFPAFPVTVI